MGVWETFRGNAWENRGVEKGMIQVENAVVVEAKVMGKRTFYEERVGCKFPFSFFYLFIWPFHVTGRTFFSFLLLFFIFISIFFLNQTFEETIYTNETINLGFTVSPLSMLKNPMILLVVFALGVTVGMPYLMEMSTCLSSAHDPQPFSITSLVPSLTKLLQNTVDPETRAEFEKQSRKGRNAAANDVNARRAAGAGRGGGAGAGAGGFDLAGWMAGTSQGPMAALDSTMKAAASGREAGSGSGARRR